MRALRLAAAGGAALAAALAGPARAQTPDLAIRAGATLMTPAMVRHFNSLGPLVSGNGFSASVPVVTRVGGEARFVLAAPAATDGVRPELSVVGLAGGVEAQALWLSGYATIGIRTERGLRVGVGPAAGLADVGVALVAGAERGRGRYRLALDGVLELTTAGPRLSLLAGLVERRGWP